MKPELKTLALVTGANRGLGLATAAALARNGCTVLIAGRDSDSVDVAVAALAGRGLDVAPLVMDVSSLASIAAASQDVGDRYGRLDVLVNNAGILPEVSGDGDHDFMEPDVLLRTFETNLFGAVATIESFLPMLRASRAGRIVNVSSTMGSLSDQSDPTSPYYATLVPAYQASKAALNSITIGLSKKLADTNIKVTSVCPGWVQTDLARGNRSQAPTSAEAACAVVVRAATLGEDASSGGFTDEDGTVTW